MKKYYVNLKGGLGLNISFIRVARVLISKGYDIKIISPYWDVAAAASIPYYKPNEFRDFIFDAKDEDAEIITDRVYDLSDFIYKKLNYKDAWLKVMDLTITDTITDKEYNHLALTPEAIFPQLKEQSKAILEDVKKYGCEDFILVQFWGGQSPLDVPPDGDWKKKPYDYQNEPLKRHYPVEKAQEFVNLYRATHPKTAVIQYSLPNEPILDGVLHYTVPYLAYYILSKKAKKAVVIDSSLQHLISGNCPMTVLWGHSLPDSFGYSCNQNIIQKCRRDDILYFTELGPSGARIDYIEPSELLDKIDNPSKAESPKA